MSRDTIRLPHDAYRLLQTLRAAGHSAYVVGGCVRFQPAGSSARRLGHLHLRPARRDEGAVLQPAPDP